MTEHLARSIADRLHARGAYLAPQYADPVGSVGLGMESKFTLSGSSLAADLRDVAAADPASQAESYAARRLEIAANYGFRETTQSKPFVYQDGLAVIPVHGLLINRFSSSWGFVTGYNFIRAQMNAALEDPDVETVVFDVNSFGGSCAGCSELSEDIFNSRLIKPSVAVVDAFCYSAGYFLASAASKVICTPSGGVGSIGVVMTHMSVARAMKDMGVDITYIYAGDHKVDGNPYEKLSPEVKADFQKSVDENYEMFVSAVARNRAMEADDVRATQARCYSAIDAKAVGLIDAVEVPSRAVATFLSELASDDTPGDEDDTDMTTQAKAAEATSAPQPAAAPAAQPAPAAPVQAGATMADIQAAISADRLRASSIRSLEESKGREALANHLADAGYSVDEAKGILAVAPKAEAPNAAPAAGGSPFHAAMDASKQPNVGAGGGEPKTGAEGEPRVSRIASNGTMDAVFGRARTQIDAPKH